MDIFVIESFFQVGNIKTAVGVDAPRPLNPSQPR
jgi:hypothetical protein